MNILTPLLCALLVACGGGGSSVAPEPTPAAPAGPVQVTAYGDSTQRNQGNPHASSRPGWTIENKGLSGSHTAEWLAKWSAELAGTKASIVIYNGGLNDGGMSVEQYKAALREMVATARVYGKQLMLEQPNNAAEHDGFNLPAFNERRAAVEHVAKAEGVYFCAQPDVPLSDGAHPTVDGYAAKAVRLAACLEELL